eukprot:11454743-Heterocapsa_arctica.AAC.2
MAFCRFGYFPADVRQLTKTCGFKVTKEHFPDQAFLSVELTNYELECSFLLSEDSGVWSSGKHVEHDQRNSASLRNSYYRIYLCFAVPTVSTGQDKPTEGVSSASVGCSVIVLPLVHTAG